jgi:hypothetical protein
VTPAASHRQATVNRGHAIVRVRALIVALGLAASACKEYHDDFCCLTVESCGGNRGPGVITPCKDPKASYCDDTGQYGPARTCIPDPNLHPCSGPQDCPTAAEPVCDDAMHVCSRCSDDQSCTRFAATPRCNTNSGACVECVDSAKDCSAAKPVCDANACRKCQSNEECESEVCDVASGACADPLTVIYVATTGVGSGTCTKGQPCNSFSAALAQVSASRKTIHADAGAYMGQILIDGKTVIIEAYNATAQPSALNQSVLVVSNGADVTIDGLTITGAGGAGNPVGVQCTSGAGSPPTLRLRRSAIKANVGGGISIAACGFSIVDSLITGNGNPNSAIGGISIGTVSGTAELQFCTIYNNGTQAAFPGGVNCTGVTSPLVTSNNIIYGNGAGKQIDGPNCSATYSDIGPQTMTGTGNINVDPQFEDAAHDKFQIKPTSPAKDVADPAATVDVDYAGTHRPQGTRSDMGAYELKQ